MYKALVEGTELIVCDKCARLGKGAKLIQQLSPKQEQKQQKEILRLKTQEQEIVQIITHDYGQKIRKARMKLDMTQEEFAKKISIKESVLQKMENSEFEPPIDMAEKLEKALHIKLIEEVEQETVEIKKEKTSVMTIGDVMLKKKA